MDDYEKKKRQKRFKQKFRFDKENDSHQRIGRQHGKAYRPKFNWEDFEGQEDEEISESLENS